MGLSGYRLGISWYMMTVSFANDPLTKSKNIALASNDDPRMTFTYFMTRSYLNHDTCIMGKLLKSIFSKVVFVSLSKALYPLLCTGST